MEVAEEETLWRGWLQDPDFEAFLIRMVVSGIGIDGAEPPQLLSPSFACVSDLSDLGYKASHTITLMSLS
ncbi:hypothetical protein BO78DRAFT_418540 [Aspergillus sclerotiicarbonarius CBS 121057]|uniref:Uncharacterized protein n=1 Tax=Aspergillus sclerotiicarbonarius (strain CBS 121057 / IBT 28362) TaxID=1448318 RepID=A0A319EFZ9_ASPSB|nr:hypothetical protein BO78DRAFT_418540 [Aspergillus sclerotiicarbonarius CBS 121057]